MMMVNSCLGMDGYIVMRWSWIRLSGVTLALIIDVLRTISQNFNDTLGANQGTQHAPPDLTNDIATLVESLNDNDVYGIEQSLY